MCYTIVLSMNYSSQIDYSDKYYDETYEYRWRRRKGVRHRHVTLPKELSKQITPGKLLSEKEWRQLGIRMSLGWEHYATHKYSSACANDFIDRSRIFCCSAGPWARMERRVR